MLRKTYAFGIGLLTISALFSSCKKHDDQICGRDINNVLKVSVDRFSSAAGHLMVRDGANGLPAANAPINMDQAPFITVGLDRTGAVTRYYNFDVQSRDPEEIYVVFKTGSTTPVEGQNNIIPSIPGDAGYTDFWQVHKVIVPENYIPNSLSSESEVLASGYQIIKTPTIVNCPVVPFGSTAARSNAFGVPSTLTTGWYKGQAVAYFNFGEAALNVTPSGQVPVAPIFVMFNDNAAGPASGFKTEIANPTQTHNILSVIPGDAGYTPLWNVLVIDNKNFNAVVNLQTAASFPNTVAGALVNCPIVK